MAKLLLVVAAVLLTAETAAAEETGSAPHLPCEAAAEIVSGTLSGDAPPGLSSWPLYEIELEATPAVRELSGRMQVSLSAPTEKMREVSFLLPPPERDRGVPPLRVTSARAGIGAEADLLPVEMEQDGLRVDVKLPRAAEEGEAVTVFLELAGRLALRRSGGFAESVGVLSGPMVTSEVGAIATDGVGFRLLGAHPVLAPPREDGRRGAGAAWGPAHSTVPACFIMSVVAPGPLTPASTGRAVGRVPEAGGRERHTFVAAGARRMGVVLVPTGLQVHERKVGEVTIRAIAKEASTAREMTDWAAGLLRHYERRFGAYPWEKLEIVESPMTGAIAGLRAPGLVLVNDMLTGGSDLLEAFSAPGTGAFAKEVAIAHQMAHQWFGELVDTGGGATPAIEEALAWYAVLDYTRTRHGVEAATRVRRRIIDLAYHVWRVTGGADAPAGASLAEIQRLGGMAAYLGLCDGKAPGLMEALAAAVGRERLRRGLRRFADSARFSHAGRRELEQAIGAAAGEEHREKVAPLFVRWLDQTHGDEDLGSSRDALSGALMDELGAGQGLDGAAMQRMMDDLLRALGGTLGQ